MLSLHWKGSKFESRCTCQGWGLPVHSAECSRCRAWGSIGELCSIAQLKATSMDGYLDSDHIPSMICLPTYSYLCRYAVTWLLGVASYRLSRIWKLPYHFYFIQIKTDFGVRFLKIVFKWNRVNKLKALSDASCHDVQRLLYKSWPVWHIVVFKRPSPTLANFGKMKFSVKLCHIFPLPFSYFLKYPSLKRWS